MEFRIGANLGDVMEEVEQIYGDDCPKVRAVFSAPITFLSPHGRFCPNRQSHRAFPLSRPEIQDWPPAAKRAM